MWGSRIWCTIQLVWPRTFSLLMPHRDSSLRPLTRDGTSRRAGTTAETQRSVIYLLWNVSPAISAKCRKIVVNDGRPRSHGCLSVLQNADCVHGFAWLRAVTEIFPSRRLSAVAKETATDLIRYTVSGWMLRSANSDGEYGKSQLKGLHI